MISGASPIPNRSLLESARSAVTEGYKYLKQLAANVMSYVGRLSSPSPRMVSASSADYLSAIEPQSDSTQPAKADQLWLKRLALRDQPAQLKIAAEPMPAEPASNEAAKSESSTQASPTAHLADTNSDNKVIPLPLATPSVKAVDGNTETIPLLSLTSNKTPMVLETPLSTSDNKKQTEEPVETARPHPPTPPENAPVSSAPARTRTLLCPHDAGKSPHFLTSSKEVLERFCRKVNETYELNLPEAAENTVLDSTFARLLDNICEPWAHNDTMKSWQLSHVEPRVVDPITKALIELDEASEGGDIAANQKAGDGIFTRDKKVYRAIVKVITDQLANHSPDHTDGIAQLKSDMEDPNFWCDLVIEPPKLGGPDSADRTMLDTFADTIKAYYSYDVIGDGLEDINAQVAQNKPFLATVHHSAHTVEIAAFHQFMNRFVEKAQPTEAQFNTDNPVRTLTHSTFHETPALQGIFDGSGCVTASQNVSRSMLSNRVAQGIVCATGGTPEAKRRAEDRHTTHWKTFDNQQRNGLASLAIETQTPVSVVTCANADELFEVKENELTEEIYKQTRKSAIDAESRLGTSFFLQLGKVRPWRLMFSAPLPLKHNVSPLIKPPLLPEPNDYDSHEAYETAKEQLSTAFSHHLEAKQQEQILFDLAFTHRDDVGTRRKTQFLIYKMMEALVKAEAPTPQSGYGIIDGPISVFKQKYQAFQASQRAMGLPENYNQSFSAPLMREIYQLADVYQFPSDFFKLDCCKSAFIESLGQVEKFERQLSPTERVTQQTWFSHFISNSLSAMNAKNYQYFMQGLPNTLYLVNNLIYGLAKKALGG